MRLDSSFVYLLLIITALHFMIGIGYILYKLGGSSKSKKKENNESD